MFLGLSLVMDTKKCFYPDLFLVLHLTHFVHS